MTQATKTIHELDNAIAQLPDTCKDAKANFVSAIMAIATTHDLPGPALASALKSRDLKLVTDVLSQWQDAAWARLYYEYRCEKIGTLLHEKQFDILHALSRAGISIKGSFNLAIPAAVAGDDPDYIEFLRNGYNDHRPIWKPKDFSSGAETCGPGLAPYYLKELQGHLENRHSAAIQSFVVFRLGFIFLKPLAVLLSTGEDITPIFRSQLKTAHPHLVRLICMTASNHGQLQLKSLEPDPLDVIGRDRDGMFYGMQAQSFLDDYPEQSAERQTEHQ